MYLAPQNIPRAIVLTLGSQVVLSVVLRHGKLYITLSHKSLNRIGEMCASVVVCVRACVCMHLCVCMWGEMERRWRRREGGICKERSGFTFEICVPICEKEFIEVM